MFVISPTMYMGTKVRSQCLAINDHIIGVEAKKKGSDKARSLSGGILASKSGLISVSRGDNRIKAMEIRTERVVSPKTVCVVAF